MKNATIADVTKEEFDSAVQTVISGIKASDPKLDTRLGTVLRSLLVNPEARLDATTTKQIDYVRKSTSLKSMLEAKESGEDVDTNDVNAILSNFNIRSSEGTKAEGIVKITVADGQQSYTISEGTEFETVDGLVFRATATTTAKQGSRTPLYEGSAGYFFLVHVQSGEVGAAYNIQQGTSLTVNASVYTFISAEAYKSFDGGSDIADLAETISKIPSGLAIRGFVHKDACEGMLRDEFDGGDHPLTACSTVGYGNAAQRRDKHNPFGVGVGGRIDLYVRNFGDLYTTTKTVIGTHEGSGTYRIVLSAADFPGGCWVKSVSDIQDVASPLEFTCRRTADAAKRTWHDIRVKGDDVSEAFNTVWQGFEVMAEEVPPDIGGSTSSSADDSWSKEREFSVSVYSLPDAAKLQEFVDRDDIRSVSTDVVVRCPIICNVSVNAVVRYDPANPVDGEDAAYRIRKYINSLGFVGRLTRSEIVHILKGCGAVSVDLSSNNMLKGALHDAYGNAHVLIGDSRLIDGLEPDDNAMLTRDTTIFAAEPENIQLQLIPNN